MPTKDSTRAIDRIIISEAAGVLQSVMEDRNDIKTKMTSLIEIVSREYKNPYSRVAEAFYEVVNGPLGTSMLNKEQKTILIPATVEYAPKGEKVTARDIDKMLSDISQSFRKLKE